MSVNTWIDKEDVVYTYNGVLLSHKKEWSNAICSNMNGPTDRYTKWSKSEREKQISYDTTYVESKKMVQMNLFTKQKQIHRLQKQTYGYQKGKVGGGIN